MESRTVKTRIQQLIKTHGGEDELASILDISPRYVKNFMEINPKTGKLFRPGKRLYRDIVQLHSDTFRSA